MEAFQLNSDQKLNLINSEFREQRPPVYNAEDYSLYLRKYCKFTGLQLYLQTNSDKNNKNKKNNNGKGSTNSSKAEREIVTKLPGFQPQDGLGEMGLKQFSTISELLGKLKTDLHLSFHSFIKEFISEPNDGITLLLDLLKVIQLSQTNLSGLKVDEDPASQSNHAVFKRALADEHETLLCLRLCASLSEDAARRLVDHPSGLFTVAVCVMSNFSKSRVLALQILTRMCEIQDGHTQVSDAISMLRLRFGEPVRFKFLIGMLNSQNSGGFQIACLRFLNSFIETAPSSREQVHIQSELEEAGLEISPLKRLLCQGPGSRSDLLKEELNRWSKNYIDVNGLVIGKIELENQMKVIQAELSVAKDKIKELELRNKMLESDRTAAMDRANVLQDRLNRRRTVPSGRARGDSDKSKAEETGVDAGDVSDQDSGKHSDNSLSQSEQGWTDKNYQCDRSEEDILIDSKKVPEVEGPQEKKRTSNRRSGGRIVVRTQSSPDLNGERSRGSERASVASVDRPKTPAGGSTDSDSVKSEYSEKQEKENSRENGVSKKQSSAIITTTENKVTVSLTDDSFVERNVSQEETMLVENEKISLDTFHRKFVEQAAHQVKPRRGALKGSSTTTDGITFNAGTQDLPMEDDFHEGGGTSWHRATLIQVTGGDSGPGDHGRGHQGAEKRASPPAAELKDKFGTGYDLVAGGKVLSKQSSPSTASTLPLTERLEQVNQLSDDLEERSSLLETKITNGPAREVANTAKSGGQHERTEDVQGREANNQRGQGSSTPSHTSDEEIASMASSAQGVDKWTAGSQSQRRVPRPVLSRRRPRSTPNGGQKQNGSTGQRLSSPISGHRDASSNRNQINDYNFLELPADKQGFQEDQTVGNNNIGHHHRSRKHSVNDMDQYHNTEPSVNRGGGKHRTPETSLDRLGNYIMPETSGGSYRSSSSRPSSRTSHYRRSSSIDRSLTTSPPPNRTENFAPNYLDMGEASTSFGFIRTTARRAEKDIFAKVKRHKSFFNSDSLKQKKANALVKRAESFHQPNHNQEFRYSPGPGHRAKSVDRLLACGDNALEDADIRETRLKKSKSMEFLKAKIFRKPSTKPISNKMNGLSGGRLGRSMSELRYLSSGGGQQPPSQHHTNSEGRSRHYPGSGGEGRSRHYPGGEGRTKHHPSPSEIKISKNRENRRSAVAMQAQYAQAAAEFGGYDWRQDTPFWNKRRQGGKRDNARLWGLESGGGAPSGGSSQAGGSPYSRQGSSSPWPPYTPPPPAPGGLGYHSSTPSSLSAGSAIQTRFMGPISANRGDPGPPPDWVPPSPRSGHQRQIAAPPGVSYHVPMGMEYAQQYEPDHVAAYQNKFYKDNLNKVRQLGRAYPSFPVNQAVNTIYLPPPTQEYTTHHQQTYSYESIVEITELDDLPLGHHQEVNILDIPGGLY